MILLLVQRGAEILEAGMRLMESSRSLLGSARILLESIWRWVIGIRAPIVTASCEPLGEETVAVADPTTEVVVTHPATEAVANQTTEIRPETQIKSAIPGAIDEGEIQRRRNLVRTFFNEFWSGAYEKPTGFLERLDQAEDYLNHRLTANGEAWRLDSETRAMLGLPSRVDSAGAR